MVQRKVRGDAAPLRAVDRRALVSGRPFGVRGHSGNAMCRPVQIVAEAVALLDAEGLDGVTTRKLAARLGVLSASQLSLT